jgi:tRNA A-37 threonylcarbamoyl transferase component Bud32
VKGGETIESARRTKWASQIEQTLGCFHAVDVVWGDAKTLNVLIDDEDDA